jgi:hypothetical protein
MALWKAKHMLGNLEGHVYEACCVFVQEWLQKANCSCLAYSESFRARNEH